MRHLRNAFFATCTCVGIAIAAPAEAQDRSFSLNAAALVPSGTATQSSTINLPKSGTGSFFISFAVPLDHERNTPITLRVHLQQPAAGPCTAATLLHSAARRRVGHVSLTTTTPNVDRIVPVGFVETTDFPATPGIVVAKNYIVRTPQTGPFGGLRAGDGFAIRIDRVSTDAADTCTGNVFVILVEVLYTSAAAP